MNLFAETANDLARQPVASSLEVEGFINPPEDFQAIFCGQSMLGAYQSGADFADRFVRGVRRYGSLPFQGATVLDFGCGWGRISRLLKRRFPDVRLYGLDRIPDALRQAAIALPDCTFAHMSEPGPPAPFRDGLFDHAFALSVFSHLGEPYHREWAAELHRLVKPGGVVAVTLHGPWLIDQAEGYATGATPKSHAWHELLARYGAQAAEVRDRWAAGEFTYWDTVEGTALGADQAYGDVLVPKTWVEPVWREAGFTLRHWLCNKAKHPQIFAVFTRD